MNFHSVLEPSEPESWGQNPYFDQPLQWSMEKKIFKNHFTGFACSSTGKESPCSAGDLGSIPGLGRSPGEGKGYPLQYSGLENSTV